MLKNIIKKNAIIANYREMFLLAFKKREKPYQEYS